MGRVIRGRLNDCEINRSDIVRKRNHNKFTKPTDFEVEEILILDPDFSIQRIRENVPLKDPSDIEHFIGGLRKAGLPG